MFHRRPLVYFTHIKADGSTYIVEEKQEVEETKAEAPDTESSALSYEDIERELLEAIEGTPASFEEFLTSVKNETLKGDTGNEDGQMERAEAVVSVHAAMVCILLFQSYRVDRTRRMAKHHPF